MTDYKSLTPPEGVDHIEYALKRVGYSAARIRVRNVNEANIVSAHAVGTSVRLVVRKPADPYYAELPDEGDASAWVNVKRIIKRFSLQEVLDHKFPSGLTTSSTTAASVASALTQGGVGLAAKDIKVTDRFGMLTITVTNLTSLIAYGTATIKQLAGAQQ